MKLKATVAYNGSGFHGFAINRDVVTVAGEIEKAIERVIGEPVTITCAGRTDKGVHGRGQVISFSIPDSADVELYRLQKSINGMCKPHIVVRDLQVAGVDFDARFSASWRRYRYQVLNAPQPDPLRAHSAWHVWDELDLDAMNAAALHLVGEQDFTSFCKRVKVPDGEPEKSMVRRVISAEWREADDSVIEFWVQATAFCHQMVRSFVGTLVDVGSGKIDGESIPAILAAKDRTAAGQVAPPQGLTFWEVSYEDL